MDRYWFFTWRTYGTWLPGEDGFVGYYRDAAGERVIDNMPGEPPARPIPRLEQYAREVMQGEPVLLVLCQHLERGSGKKSSQFRLPRDVYISIQ